MSISGIVQGYTRLNEWAGKKLGNTATLSGAIDIIVIEQENGMFISSPFYVRIGKFGAFTAKDTDVDISINDEPVDICMKLDEDGNAAYFNIVPLNDEDDVDSPESILVSTSEQEGTPTNAESNDVASQYGINGTPLTSSEKTYSRQFSRQLSTQSIERKARRMTSNATLRSENIFQEDGKSLRFSSKIFPALNLQYGQNEVEFSVTNAYQGTTRCNCNLFVWKWTDKIIISDIDGTITKSDVRGQLLPKLGKDWSQIGVASLFAKISQNGYRIAYLSARPIGQATSTKEYLKSVSQGDIKLPDGPLLLTPDSLLISVHREVIIKKPEEFKIECLQVIKDLFPKGSNPFYSGYGNRTNDVFAYTTVGIPRSRVFTINPKGELKHELTPTSNTSYKSHSEIVDHIYPPLSFCDEVLDGTGENPNCYSTFNYWREPVEDVCLENPTKM